MKTPGIYIVEQNAFPSSVVEVPTAVPAFIGWTERAAQGDRSLHLKPHRIASMAQFQRDFGGGPVAGHVRFQLSRLSDAESAGPGAGAAPAAGDSPAPLAARDAEPLHLGDAAYRLTQVAGHYLLARALRLYFMNGGGECIVVSVGGYGDAVERAPLEAGLQVLAHETGPTLLVVPDAVLLPQDECRQLQGQMLQQCGQTLRDRFAILDVWEGYRPRQAPAQSTSGDPDDSFDAVAAFRAGLVCGHRDFGAAYYPWLHTTVVGADEVGLVNIAPGPGPDPWIAALREEHSRSRPGQGRGGAEAAALAALAALEAQIGQIRAATDDEARRRMTQALATASPVVQGLLAEMTRRLNLLPPAAALAGVYALVDRSRGVWKAPANVSLDGVDRPAVTVSAAEQEDLNVSVDGKSVNAIRSFAGEGTLVWGARTLDGNSLDWRYLSVRRTLIMLEQSIRLALRSLVFEPNAAPTWQTLKAMVANFLTSVGKRGGRAGAVPEDAFSVHAGLGETMTDDDLRDGVMRLTVLVAVSRPAEFIEITLQEPMQGA